MSSTAGDGNRRDTDRRLSSLYAQITLGMIAVHEFLDGSYFIFARTAAFPRSIFF